MTSKVFILVLSGIALASSLDADARSSGSRDAEWECRDAMERRYDADGFHGITVSHRRHGYEVSGYAERRHEGSEWFECEVEDGRVEYLDFEGFDRDYDDDHHDSDKRKKIAAGIAAAAVIAAIASSRKSHSNDHDYDYSHHDNDDDRPATWNPQSGVTCYKYSKQCLNSRNGSYNAYWTNREFH